MKRDIIVGVSSTLITIAIVGFFSYLASAAPKWFVNEYVVPNMPPSTTVSTSLHEVPASELGKNPPRTRIMPEPKQGRNDNTMRFRHAPMVHAQRPWPCWTRPGVR